MNHQSIKSSNNDSIEITEFHASSSNGKVIIFNNAAAVNRAQYFRLASFLTQYGFHCICWNYPGTNDNELNSSKFNSYSINDWGFRHFHSILDHALTKFPGFGIYLFAHSIGGILPGLCSNHSAIKGMIGYGVQTAYWKDWKFPEKVGHVFVWNFILPMIARLWKLFPNFLRKQRPKLPLQYILHWSKRWRQSSILDLFEQHNYHPIFFQDLNFPIIHINAEDDPIATPKAVERFNSLVPNCPTKEIWIVPSEIGVKKIGHVGLVKTKCKDKIWKEIPKYIEELDRI